ncbi:MAG: extracellular solute-binding protein [Rhodobacteraceae bacterium]|jgi:ABC-type Fe3+ transport system substrate-binding protein|nr:extracellular solute-binding protein [Paracoccaceae bacterium]
MKNVSTSLALAMVLVSTTAANAADQALIDAAMAEGQVVWYTSLIQDQAVRPMVAAFEAKYPGITVEAVTGKSTDLLLRITDEVKANSLRADVHHGGGAAQTLIAQGMVAEFVPDSAAAYPDDLKDPAGLWTAHVVNFLVPAYNTDLVDEADAPKSYDDLLDPKWQGQIAWAASMTQGGPPGFIGTVLGTMGQEEGMAYLTKLSEQRIINVPANQRVTLDQVIAGEYPIALCTFSHHAEISAAQGAPVKWIALEPMVTNTVDPIFLLAGGPNPNAGKLFIDFVISDEGQQVLADAEYIPANPAFRVGGVDASPAAFTLSPSEVGSHLNDWIKVYDELFK